MLSGPTRPDALGFDRPDRRRLDHFMQSVQGDDVAAPPYGGRQMGYCGPPCIIEQADCRMA